MMSRNDKLHIFIDSLAEKNIGTYYSAFSEEALKFGSRPLFTSEPDSLAVPYHWSYKECLDALVRLTEYLTIEQSERRAIHLMNPGLKNIPGGNASILPTLYGGFQLIKPGDIAPSHRHTPVNFRFVIDAPSKGAFTVINGYKIELHRGDLTAQIPWVWHEHHNEGDSDLIWFAGLDAPLISYLGAMFYQHPEEVPANSSKRIRGTGEDASYIYGNGVIPVIEPESVIEDFNSRQNPLPYYPYHKVDSALGVLTKKTNSQVAVIEYKNPITGGPLFNSISAGMMRLLPNASIGALRSTENIVYVSFNGNFKVEVEGINHVVRMSPGDVLAVPSWKKHTFENEDEDSADMFYYSDRPLFEYLGLYRKKIE